MENAYRIEARDINWSAVLGRLFRSLDGKPKDGWHADQVLVELASDMSIWTVSRDILPASQLAAALGTTEEAVVKAKVIKLGPMPGDKDWPAPTVPYTGEA